MAKPRTAAAPEGRSYVAFLLLYGAMGFMTLAHEVAWTRQLIGMVGSALGAVSIMLAVFMTGLALGSWAGGRFGALSSDPVRLLSTTCVLAGGTALLSIPVDRVASIAIIGIRFPALDATTGVLVVLAITVPVMLLPSFFVGAAFPVLADLVSAHKNLVAGVGKVLASQTFGSIVGALAAGFFLLPTFGVDTTIAVGAAVAIAGGLMVSPLKIELPPKPSGPAASSTDDTRRVERVALIALVLSGAATLTYEVAWARELLLVFGSSVYSTAGMLVAVLVGLGLGQWWGARLKAGLPSGLTLVAKLILGAAITGLFSVVLSRTAPILYTYAFTTLPAGLLLFAVVQVLLSCLVVLAPAFLVGAASPLMIRFAVGTHESWSRESGTAYALNTAGAVAGSLVAGFGLLPSLSAKGAVAVAAGLQVIVALMFIRTAKRFGAEGFVPALGIAGLVAAIAAFASVQAASPLLNLSLTRAQSASAAQLIDIARASKPVYFRDTAAGRVAVYQLPDGRYVLRGSGMVEGGQGIVDAQTTELLVRLPAAAAASAENYLVIGLGTGSTTYTALRVPGVKSVDTVELNRAVVPAARYFVGDSLDKDRRSHVVIDDARVYVATTDKKYDVIVSEPSYPLSPFSAQLFTTEFFNLERQRLKPGGVAVQWLPVYLLDQPDVAMMVKTFASAFPNTHVWSTRSETGQLIDLIMVGVNGDAALNPDAITRQVRSTGGESFKFEYEFGPQDLKTALDDASIPMNTDDKPLLEYRTPLRQIEALWR